MDARHGDGKVASRTRSYAGMTSQMGAETVITLYYRPVKHRTFLVAVREGSPGGRGRYVNEDTLHLLTISTCQFPLHPITFPLTARHRVRDAGDQRHQNDRALELTEHGPSVQLCL